MPGQIAELNRTVEIGDSKSNGSDGERYTRENTGHKPKPKRKPQDAGFIANQPSN